MANKRKERSKQKSPYPLKGIRRKKANIKKNEAQMTVHHRRPLSLDGLDREWNKSNISLEIHTAWTIIAGNMSAEQICNHININFKPRGLTLICIFINGKKCTKSGKCGSEDQIKMSYAWRVLFRRYSRFKDKIDYINNVLLDPSYHFYIRE